MKTLIELGIKEDDFFINNKTPDYYNPGRSGSIYLKSANGPQLAYFGEIHPSIVSNIDLKEQNIFMHDGKEDQVLMSLNLEIIEIFLKDLKIIFCLD